MTTKQATDELRSSLRGMWTAVAGQWGANADYVDERGESVTQAMLRAADPRPGERVLELACGPGSVGIAAARLVGPDGEVVLSDVVEEMTAIAAARAADSGLTNVATRVLDIEVVDQPDAAYDVVLCREGLMFATDPERAVREIGRLLRPGGRTAVAVWGPRERNPWLGLVLDAVSEIVGRPLPPPGIPGPFSLADASALAALFTEATFTDVSVGEIAVPLRAGSFDEWWERTCALAGPLATILGTLPPQAREAIRARARTATEPYAGPGGLDFPGVSLLATGRRR